MADTDNDGIPDVLDLDADGDGTSNEQERLQGTDPFDPLDSGGRSVPAPAAPPTSPLPPASPPTQSRIGDLDGDGLPDVFDLDADGDGTSNEQERLQGTDPFDALDGGGRSVPAPAPVDPPTPAPVPPTVPKRPVEITQVRDDATVADFLAQALAQVGDRYQRGVEASINDADPDAFDGSELVEWGANRSGVMINDGAANQFRQMSAHGTTVPVDQALRTPGAILYEFTGDPSQPTRASTAISLGDGRIIDIDPVAGVRIMPADQFTFTHAGTMPGFVDGASPDAAATAAVVEAAYAKLGLEPMPGSTDTGSPDAAPGDPESGEGSSTPDPTGTGDTAPDDGGAGDPAPVADGDADATALAARARTLRDELVQKVESEQGSFDTQRRAAERELDAAGAAVRTAQQQVDQAKQSLEMDRTMIETLEQSATEMEAEGRALEATERREAVEKARASQRADERQVTELEAERDALAQKAVETNDRKVAVQDAEGAANDRRLAAEGAIDAMEEKARYLQEAAGHSATAERLRTEATQLRADGKGAEADQRLAQATEEDIAAGAKRGSAAEQVVDETALTGAGLGGGTTATPIDPTDPVDPTGGDTDPAGGGDLGLDPPAPDGSTPPDQPDQPDQDAGLPDGSTSPRPGDDLPTTEGGLPDLFPPDGTPEVPSFEDPDADLRIDDQGAPPMADDTIDPGPDQGPSGFDGEG